MPCSCLRLTVCEMGSDSSLTDDDSELMVKGELQSPSVAGRRLRPQLRAEQIKQQRRARAATAEVRFMISGGAARPVQTLRTASARTVFTYTNLRNSCLSSALNECSARNSQTTTSALALSLLYTV